VEVLEPYLEMLVLAKMAQAVAVAAQGQIQATVVLVVLAKLLFLILAQLKRVLAEQ
jgi:hypothetical protein